VSILWPLYIAVTDMVFALWIDYVCWSIDATEDDGSLGRLVNDEHRRPNCVMKLLEVDGSPHLCLFAVTDLLPGTELRYNYGDGHYIWRSKVSWHSLLRVEMKFVPYTVWQICKMCYALTLTRPSVPSRDVTKLIKIHIHRMQMRIVAFIL